MAESLVAIVTGGAQGLGAAITTALLDKGYRVCVSDINKTKCDDFVSQLQSRYGKGGAIAVGANVVNESDVKKLFEAANHHFGRVDVLVNNAGIMCEQEPWKVLEVNVMGPLLGCQLALKYMGTSNGGKGGIVINTASLSGFVPHEAMPSYTASKHAVIGLTRCYGLPYHLSRDGVTFCAICPHLIDTDLLNGSVTRSLIPELDFREGNKDNLMTPEYVAQGYIKILEDKINGSTMVITKKYGYQYVGVQEEALKMVL